MHLHVATLMGRKIWKHRTYQAYHYRDENNFFRYRKFKNDLDRKFNEFKRIKNIPFNECMNFYLTFTSNAILICEKSKRIEFQYKRAIAVAIKS